MTRLEPQGMHDMTGWHQISCADLREYRDDLSTCRHYGAIDDTACLADEDTQ